ncbi:GNAT family N-acetyltransferase [Ruania zhangjianzhongii]|uniref:GNAT family N-acetyltransferase n=1 Tax=Ruania zhangjianzhongii TaxID=2603206 RepID=UPI0011C995F3|nr:GNAT family N-acetyltransferase [Ruania zhangjianzhongii]
MEIVQPASADEAIRWLAASPPPFESPTQQRFRRMEHLQPAFERGQRRPEWVWAALDGGGEPAAVVAGLGHADGLILDYFGAADPAALTPALRAATAAAREFPEAEACLYAPPGLPATSEEVRAVVSALAEAGWQLLVERCHYEFTPEPGLAGDDASTLRLEQLHGPDDARLIDLQREIMRETLDAHDRVLIERDGLEAATRQAMEDVLDADPWECIHLAYADGTGLEGPVGFASWRAMTSGRGYLAFVGVAQTARGHGFGRQLVTLATAGLIADGATTLIADTDRTNYPMVRAFADAGWPETETRMDFTPIG